MRVGINGMGRMGRLALRAAMGQNGRAYVHRHYRWSTILNKYERLFQRLHRPAAPERPPAHRRRR